MLLPPPAFRPPRRPPRALLWVLILVGSACHSLAPPPPQTYRAAAPTLETTSPDHPVAGRLEAGESRDFLLWVPADHYVRVEVEQRGIDLQVTVLDPAGRSIAWADGPGGNWVPESASWISRTGGDHRLRLAPADGETRGGEFRIEVAELRPARPADDGRLAADAAFAEARGLADDDDRAAETRGLLDCAYGHFVRLGDARRQAEVVSQTALLSEGEEEVALSELAVASWEATGDAAQVVVTRARYAAALHQAGDAAPPPRRQELRDRAIAEARNAVRQGETAGDDDALAFALDRLGFLYHRQEQLRPALVVLQRAAELRRQSGDVPGEYFTLLSLGAVQRNVGYPYQALDSYRRAIELADRHAYYKEAERASLLLNYGYLLRRLGDTEAAQRAFEEAIELSRRQQDRTTEYRLHLHLGSLSSQLGEPEQAREQLELALHLAGNAEDVLTYDQAYALFLLGWLEASEERPEEALSFFAQAMGFFSGTSAEHPTFQRLLGYLKLGIGSAHRLQGDLDSALDDFRQAIPLLRGSGSSTGEIDALLRLGQLQVERGALTEARRRLDAALEKTQGIQDPLREGAVRSQMARLEDAAGAPVAAIAQLQRSIEIREDLRAGLSVPAQRATFLADWRQDYDFLIDLLMRRGEDGGGEWALRAFTVSERSHARTLLELLADARLDLQAGVPPELKEREVEVDRRLSLLQTQLIESRTQAAPDRETILALEDQLTQARADRERVEREIWRRSPRYAEVRDPQAPDLEAVRAALPAGTALLEYALGDERSYLFVVTSQRFKAYRLPPAGDISKLVDGVREGLSRHSRDPRSQRALSSRLHDLYELLVAPARGQLDGVTRLIVVPDRDLYYLPFETLRVEASPPSEASPADSFLLARWAVGYIPSASILVHLQGLPALRQPQLELLALADPMQPTAPGNGGSAAVAERAGAGAPFLPPIPGARQEVQSLEALFGAPATSVLLGSAATESRLKRPGELSRARFIHFATHGVISLQQPAYSYLLLSPDPAAGEDGILHVFEILDLDLRADMVVLSACQTALGKEVRGEGIIGLTRSFLYAGARRVVVSLWPVSDASTPLLMVHFYSGIRGGLDTLEALRQAKLKLLESGTYAQPYYWAPFILVGTV